MKLQALFSFKKYKVKKIKVLFPAIFVWRFDG